MNIHRRAKTTPSSRALLVGRVEGLGWTVSRASEAQGISTRTAYKWLRRWREEGAAGLEDRSSAPHRTRRRLAAETLAWIVQLRRQHRLCAVRIADITGVPRATIGRVLREQRISRARDLEERRPANRYERAAPGELIHLDIKPLARIAGVGHRIHGDRTVRTRGLGYEYAHVAIDDFSRLAYVELLPDQRGATTRGFLERSLQWFRDRGVVPQRVLTDNGPCYLARVFRQACAEQLVKHRRTRPFTPRTNGKAERFIQTALREWAYRRPYTSSELRRAALEPWLHLYNHHRPHSALARQPPVSRLNNLVSLNT